MKLGAKWQGLWVLACFNAGLGMASFTGAAIPYRVRVELPQSMIDSLRLTIDLTSSDNASNRVLLTALNHDGHARAAEGVGGPVAGDVDFALNPSDTLLLEDGYFYNQAAIPFDTLGSYIRFNVELSGNAASPSMTADAMAFYVTNSFTGTPIPSADGLGANALFAITATGLLGGELEVFAPMSFIAPDSLLLRVDLTAVHSGPVAQGRLRIVQLGPNPTFGELRLRYDVPQPGGRVVCRIYDVAGRLVREVHRGDEDEGVHEIEWDGRDRNGRVVTVGVYLARVDFGGQTVVRRFAVKR